MANAIENFHSFFRNSYLISHKQQFSFSWSNGLLFHQAAVDLARSAILIPMGGTGFFIFIIMMMLVMMAIMVVVMMVMMTATMVIVIM